MVAIRIRFKMKAKLKVKVDSSKGQGQTKCQHQGQSELSNGNIYKFQLPVSCTVRRLPRAKSELSCFDSEN